MSDLGRRIGRVAIFGLLGLLWAVCGPAQAAAGGWQISPTPNHEGHNVLYGVSADGRGGVWAVGISVHGNDQQPAPLVEHRVHGQWLTVPSAAIPSSHDVWLNGVVAVSVKDAWIVGFDIGAMYSALIEHWNGATWTRYPDVPSWTRLDAVAQVPHSNHVWAVGDRVDSSEGLAAYWTGRRWRFMHLPVACASTCQPQAVVAIASDDVWALGSDSNEFETWAPGTSFASHWNGRHWRTKRLPSAYRWGTGLQAAASVPGTHQVWAVGLRERNIGEATVAAHLQRGRWQFIKTPTLGLHARLTGVVARSADDVWAVGYWGPDWGLYRTLTEHYDGHRWQIVPSPNRAPRTNQLFAITRVPKTRELWAVGGSGQLWPTTRTLAVWHH